MFLSNNLIYRTYSTWLQSEFLFFPCISTQQASDGTNRYHADHCWMHFKRKNSRFSRLLWPTSFVFIDGVVVRDRAKHKQDTELCRFLSIDMKWGLNCTDKQRVVLKLHPVFVHFSKMKMDLNVNNSLILSLWFFNSTVNWTTLWVKQQGHHHLNQAVAKNKNNFIFSSMINLPS